ncbi:hypothetical protein SEMRO_3135_G344340.1 [Seminavis robusta]|uniref:Uncharacterized protein n=1 Tax=Seminavis robusta TaxID=568900 RepID=A0A9N8F2T9_9STRA|nr:hypothetical protein SEMRO_3135_G344340.1 [Seminavis robusta]|eukprot:Sro3135_g344340.1 n/a (248) ;mRNA; f:4753-5496
MGRLFPNDRQLQLQVESLMNHYCGLAELLYEISTMMKSQRKWSERAASRFETITRQYAERWLEFIAKTGDAPSANSDEMTVFNKLHVLRSHLTPFAIANQMIGRCSEEGFESAHKCIESIMHPLVCMTSTETRTYTIFKRIMLQCRPEIEAILREIKERFTGKKRAPYTKTLRALKSSDNALSAASEQHSQTLPEEFIHSINGYIIKEGWKDHFEFICMSKVPASWSDPFSSDESLGGVYRANADYI